MLMIFRLIYAIFAVYAAPSLLSAAYARCCCGLLLPLFFMLRHYAIVIDYAVAAPSYAMLIIDLLLLRRDYY